MMKGAKKRKKILMVYGYYGEDNQRGILEKQMNDELEWNDTTKEDFEWMHFDNVEDVEEFMSDDTDFKEVYLPYIYMFSDNISELYHLVTVIVGNGKEVYFCGNDLHSKEKYSILALLGLLVGEYETAN